MRISHRHTLCVNCYDDSFFTCECCGEIFRNANLISVCDSVYCENCAPEEENNEDSEFLRYSFMSSKEFIVY
jgi:hypothetical protein